MKHIVIVTISHQAKDVRLYYKLAKTLSQRYNVTILHNQDEVHSDDESINLVRLNIGNKLAFIGGVVGYLVTTKPEIVVIVEPILLTLTKLYPFTKYVYDCHEFFGLAQREKSADEFTQKRDSYIHTKLEKSTIPNLHACITVNEILTDHYSQLGVNTVTIPNFPIIKSRERLVESKRYDFIYLGGLSDARGIKEIIRAASEIKEETSNLKILIVGKEQIEGFSNETRELIKSLDLTKNIEIRSAVPYQEVAKLLAQAKCGICMLSPKTVRYKYALPIKLLEYLDAGLLVITNDFPYNKKIYNSSEGIFTSKFSVEDIASNMRKALLVEPTEAEQHQLRMREMIDSKYSWNLLEPLLLDTFDNLVSSSRRALMLAYFFPPLGGAGVQRPLKFVKYSKNLGWNIDTLTIKDTVFHSYDDTFLKEINSDILRAGSWDIMSILNTLTKLKSTSIDEKVNSAYFNSSEFKKKLVKSLFFIDEKIGWYIPALLKALKEYRKKRYEVIIITLYPPSALLIALSLSKLLGIPYIIDYRDHWTLSSYFDFSNDFSRRSYHKLEAYFISQSKGILTIGNVMKQELINAFNIPEDKVAVMYNGFDEEDFYQKESTSNSKITFSYVGNMYKHRTSKFFLQALTELIEEGIITKEEINLRFMGNYYSEEQEVFNSSPLKSMINIIPQQVHEEAIKEMLSSDILLLLIGSKSGKNVLTGKIFEYLKCNKPILGLVPEGGEAEDILHSVGNYWTSEAENVANIKVQLISIIDSVKSGQVVSYDVDAYGRKEQTRHGLAFIEQRCNLK